jgi:hypothetical protein
MHFSERDFPEEFIKQNLSKSDKKALHVYTTETSIFAPCLEKG